MLLTLIMSSHSGTRFSRQSPSISLPTTGAYRGSTIHILGSKFPRPFISSSSNKRNEGMLRATTTIPDFIGPFHSSGFVSIAPSRPSPINMESFASQPNNMQANFGRGSAHVGRVNLIATERGAVAAIGQGAIANIGQSAVIGRGAVANIGQGAVIGWGAIPTLGQGGMNNGRSGNHGNYNGNFYPNYTAPDHGGGGNAPRAGCNVYNHNSTGHGVGGINVARQNCYITNRPSGRGFFGSGVGNIDVNFNKRSNLVQNQQQHNAHFGPATNRGILSTYAPMIRLLTEISVDIDFGNSAVDKVRAETIDDLISLCQSFDWGSVESSKTQIRLSIVL